jgi:hypothetical protein
MGNYGSAEPVGDGEYVVDQGECVASLALEDGFLIDWITSSAPSGRVDLVAVYLTKARRKGAERLC